MSGCFLSCVFKQRWYINSWLEVDLGESTVVSGVITQGDHFEASWWRVTEFKMKYKKLSSSGYDDVLDHTGALQVHIHLLAV